MSEGAFSGEPVSGIPPAATSKIPKVGGASGGGGSGWGNAPGQEPEEQEAAAPPRGSRKALLVLVALVVIAAPICVGIFAFMNPTVVAGDTGDGETLDAMAEDAVEDVVFADPRWTRPAWADSLSGVTAFELSAANDVLFANGRLRPTLGVTCADDRTDVHVVTGGTAIVDPQTSGHVVHLVFDDATEQTQQWTAADDMRALFAPAPLEMAYQITKATRLRFGFSHYMSGPVEVEFDLRGADSVITAMAEPCGWGDAD